MQIVVDQILPVFLLIGIGWALARTGYVTSGMGDSLSQFVFTVIIPVMLFRTMFTADELDPSAWKIWVAYFGAAALIWAAAHLLAVRGFGSDAKVGVVAGVSAAFANSILIGLPLVDRLLDHAGMVALSILIALHLPLMMICGSLLLNQTERAEGDDARSRTSILLGAGRKIIQNPLILGLLAGMIGRASGLPFAGPARTVIDAMADTAGPTALLALGMSLRKYGLTDFRIATSLSALKLLALPALVWTFSRLLGLPEVWTAALVLTAALPTGVNAFLLASSAGTGQDVASSTIIITSAVSIVTVSGWALLLLN